MEITTNQNIPTEYDDIHLPEDQPNLIIIFPLPGQIIKETNLNTEVVASAKRGIKKIEYYLDYNLILTKNDASDAPLDLSDFTNGGHTLTIKAKDDLENTATKSVNLNFNLPAQKIPQLSWLTNGGSTVKIPFTLAANLDNWQKIKKIDFYGLKDGDKIEQYLTHLEPNSSNISITIDKKLESGDYSVYGNIFDLKNKKIPTEAIKIIIK